MGHHIRDCFDALGMVEFSQATFEFSVTINSFPVSVNRKMGPVNKSPFLQSPDPQSPHGSKLFLDEIGDLPPKIQSELLRIIQFCKIKRLGEYTTWKVDVRIIAATNRDLKYFLLMIP
jgi:hypothetical protein